MELREDKGFLAAGLPGRGSSSEEEIPSCSPSLSPNTV